MIDQAQLDQLCINTKQGWFAPRPSGTENIYKIYAESFHGIDHLHRILTEAQTLISDALATDAAAPQAIDNTDYN